MINQLHCANLGSQDSQGCLCPMKEVRKRDSRMHLDLSHEGLAVSASHRTEWKAADTSLESGLHLLYKASGRPSYTSNHLLRLAAVFRDGHKGDTFFKTGCRKLRQKLWR